MNKAYFEGKESFSFSDLVEIVAILRSAEGCPWDREQTHTTLRNNFVEEAYEVCEGIDQNDNTLLCEELGDVLLQVVFHTGIAKDEGAFQMDDVICGICKKMISRHPHVFASEKEGKQESWEEIKKREKGEKSLSDSLCRISTSLPALKRAEKFIKKGAAPLSSQESEKAKLTRWGEKFYDLCDQAVKAGVDPEEALNCYLKNIIKKCTNCE